MDVNRLQPPAETPSSEPLWLMTFADLLSLLLTFFVLMFAMSEPRLESWRALVDSMADRFRPAGFLAGGERPDDPARGAIVARGTDLRYLAAVLEQKMQADPLLATGQIARYEDRLIVSLPTDLLFPAGSAELAAEARSATFALAGMLDGLPNRVEVQGHADPRPPGRGFKSNWELSLARADAVAEAFRAAGFGRPLVRFGIGDSRFDQVAGATTDDRLRQARRVDVIIREIGNGRP